MASIKRGFLASGGLIAQPIADLGAPCQGPPDLPYTRWVAAREVC